MSRAGHSSAPNSQAIVPPQRGQGKGKNQVLIQGGGTKVEKLREAVKAAEEAVKKQLKH